MTTAILNLSYSATQDHNSFGTMTKDITVLGDLLFGTVQNHTVYTRPNTDHQEAARISVTLMCTLWYQQDVVFHTFTLQKNFREDYNTMVPKHNQRRVCTARSDKNNNQAFSHHPSSSSKLYCTHWQKRYFNRAIFLFHITDFNCN